MALQHKSAGDGTTPGSVAQTGIPSLDQARDARSAGASSLDQERAADLAAELRRNLRRMHYLADASGAFLQIYVGTEIDREDMLGAFEQLAELARLSTGLLSELDAWRTQQ